MQRLRRKVISWLVGFVFILQCAGAASAYRVDLTQKGFNGPIAEFFGIKWGDRIDNLDEMFVMDRDHFSYVSIFSDKSFKYYESRERIDSPVRYGSLAPEHTLYGFVEDSLVFAELTISGPNALNIVYDELAKLYGPLPPQYRAVSASGSLRCEWDLYITHVIKLFSNLEIERRVLRITLFSSGRALGEGEEAQTVHVQYSYLPDAF